MLVKRVMSKKVVSVSVPGSREKVLDLMRKENKAVLPVIKEDNNKLVGVVTRSDLINNPDEEQIAMLMSRNLIVASPDDDVKDAARIMIENDVRRVPVVNDDGELVGIITSFDFLAAVEEESPEAVYRNTEEPFGVSGNCREEYSLLR